MSTDSSTAADLMALACQRHCEALTTAHKRELVALREARLARERELLARCRALFALVRANEGGAPAHRALVEVLSGFGACHISSRSGTVTLDGTAIGISQATQQVVLSAMPAIAEARARRHAAQEVLA